MSTKKRIYSTQIENDSYGLLRKLEKRDALIALTSTPEQRRAIVDTFELNADPPFEEVQTVKDVHIVHMEEPGCRLYHPSPLEDLHCLVWFHGGGHYSGDLETHDRLCRHFANKIGCAVLNVGYRLAPENPFPAAYEDALDAIRWVGTCGSDHDLIPSQVLVGGSSAGGNLAAAASIGMQNDKNIRIIHQTLVYPTLDATLKSDTYNVYRTGFSYTTEKRVWSRDLYQGDFEDHKDPRLSPLFAATCRGLPAATIISAELDPLRGEAEAFALRLLQDGVPVSYTCYAGVMHGFFSQSGILNLGRLAVDEAVYSMKYAINTYFKQEPHLIKNEITNAK